MRLTKTVMAAGLVVWGVAAASAAQAETLLERGTYLMRGIVACGNCHTPPVGPNAGKELAGGFRFGGPKAPLDAYSANITPDRETGIGKWTDTQIFTAIRDGKKPDGSVIGPPMPVSLYRHMSDRDIKAIIAYLRQVKPVRNKVKVSTYRFNLPPSYGPPMGSVPDVPPTDKVAYGRYLAGPLGHCVECHTPLVKGHPDFEHQLGAGGQEFPGPWGVAVSANLTPAGRLSGWTDRQIKDIITTGVRPDGSKLIGPMAFRYYANISDADLDALVAYLRTLKPISK